jgi:hypothetical protein
MQLAIVIRAAFLLFGAGTSVVSQLSCKFRPEYVPPMSRIRPKYQAPTFKVEMSMLEPAALKIAGMIMCQKDS